MTRTKITDAAIERMISVLLRTGVLVAGATVLSGGIYYLLRHGSERIDYHTFHSQPASDRILHEIVRGAIHLRARSIIQLGVVILIATPILRVAFSLVAFAMEPDRTYVVISSIVLAVLLYSLISGAVAG